MAVNVQVYDFYQWSIWWKRYQLELTLRPLLQIFERPKTCTDPPFLYMWPAELWSFWAANSTAICKRICAFPLNVAFILCGLCKEHSEKEVSRKNNEGKGWGVRVVKTPLMVLFNKSSFRILTDLCKRYEWFILTALVNIRRSITLWKCEVTAMGSSVRRLTFKKSTLSTGSLGHFAA